MNMNTNVRLSVLRGAVWLTICAAMWPLVGWRFMVVCLLSLVLQRLDMYAVSLGYEPVFAFWTKKVVPSKPADPPAPKEGAKINWALVHEMAEASRKRHGSRIRTVSPYLMPNKRLEEMCEKGESTPAEIKEMASEILDTRIDCRRLQAALVFYGNEFTWNVSPESITTDRGRRAREALGYES